MFSQVLFRFSKPNSCLLFLIFLSYFHHLPCALSQRDLRLCDTLFRCGNLTAGFPFWGDRRPEPCGHPSLALHCDHSRNNTYLIISGQMYSVLQINNATNTLRLARQDFLGESFCSATFTGTTLTPELFEPSSDYKSLFVYYLCEFHYPASFTCPKIGVASVHKNEVNHENCGASFNITVPASYVPEEEALNLTRLESILRNGFEVKLKIDDRPCQECQSSTGGICGYDVATPVCCKTNSSSGSVINCNPIIPSGPSGGFSLKAKTGIGLASGVVVVILVAGGLFCAISWLKKTSYDRKQQKLKAFIPLKQYSYAQVKRMTKSFAEVVGKGGFGTVYRGTFCDGRSVAVKVLKESKSDGEEFINEVASMSKTFHVNIVSLLGFCSDGSQRAIIYEFVENGSLDKFISSNTSMKLGVEVLYGIALGVARGLEYLHYGCKTRIVHFDIKPSNVLLDKNLCPKVSDFGLAKLCEKKESIMSLLDTRGTIGYIAPEMISRVYGNVSHKSDVYSYGMLVLEMIGARNKTSPENSASDPSSMYFPEWIYKDLEKGYDGRPIENGISSEEEEISKKMTLVGLWCIQSSPSNRPPMNKVVEMMDGSLEALKVPPRPVLQQIPAGPFQESSLLSDNISLTSFDDILMFSNDFPSHL